MYINLVVLWRVLDILRRMYPPSFSFLTLYGLLYQLWPLSTYLYFSTLDLIVNLLTFVIFSDQSKLLFSIHLVYFAPFFAHVYYFMTLQISIEDERSSKEEKRGHSN